MSTRELGYVPVRQTWARLARVYRLEVRLLALHWAFPCVHAVWAALLVALFWERFDRTAQSLLEATLGRFGIALVTLMAFFVAGFSVTRSQRARLEDLDQAFPTGLEVPLGRWLAATSVLLTFLVEPVALAGLQGPAASLWAGLPKGTPPSDGPALVVVSRWLLAGLEGPDAQDPYQLQFVAQALVADLWALSGGQPAPDLVADVSRFLWAHYILKGDAAAIAAALSVPESGPAAAGLLQVYQAQGEAGVVRALSQLQQHANDVASLDADQLQAWIVEAAGES